jgi:hypothetical protein
VNWKGNSKFWKKIRHSATVSTTDSTRPDLKPYVERCGGNQLIQISRSRVLGSHTGGYEEFYLLGYNRVHGFISQV